MRKNLLAAAVASAILTLSPAVNAAIVDVSSDKTITYDAAGSVTDSHKVTSGTLTFDAGANDLTFTSASKEHYPSFATDEEFYGSIAVQDGAVNIKAGTLSIESVNETTGVSTSTTGTKYVAAWLNGNAALTIDVDKLHVGTAEQGGDRVFRMQKSGNNLTIYANEIISYQGDGFVNAQGTRNETANVVSIGTAERRVGLFESHTSWGKDDYAVAILQANEGSTVSLFAKDVVLDGSSHALGGVIGSGSFGTVLVDADTVTIDGNICGSYGTTKDAGKVLKLAIKANELNMTGDVNVGSQGRKYSHFDRDTIVDIQVAKNAVIDGDINVTNDSTVYTEGATNNNTVNLTFNGTGKITGTINVNRKTAVTYDAATTRDAAATNTVNLGGNADMSASSGKFAVSDGSTVNFGGTGLWTVNDWSGTDGNLGVEESVTVQLNTAVTTVSTELKSGTANFVLNEGGTLTTENLTSTNATVRLNAIGDTPAVTATNLNGSLGVVASGEVNDGFADANAALEAMQAAVNVGTPAEGSNLQLSADEGAASKGWTAEKNADGTWTVKDKGNLKLDAFASVTTLSAVQWRHEMNDLTKRMGELRDNPGAVGGWVRLYGSEMEYGNQNVTAKNTSVQIGSDYQIGDWKLGGAFTYTDGKASYDLGEADNKSFAVALYGTWMADNGLFLDLIGKYGRISNDFRLNGMDGEFDNNAYSVSAELGWRFDPCSYGFIEPQVELTYGRIEGDTFTTKNAAQVSQDDFDSLIGRVGVRFGVKFPKDRGDLYLRVSGAHDFQGENKADVRAVNGAARQKLSEDLGGSWVETALGGNFRLSDATNVYVDLERTTGAKVEENWRWNLGIRTEF